MRELAEIRKDKFKIGQTVFFDMPSNFPPCAKCGYQTRSADRNQSLIGDITTKYIKYDFRCLRCKSPWTSWGYIIRLTNRPAIDDNGTKYWKVFAHPEHIHEIIDGGIHIAVRLLN